ncbi:MAG: sulfite exporter TauE/SafE family protein [Pseudomonadota bacterium]
MEYTVFVVIAFFSSLVSAIFGIGTALLLLGVGAFVLPVKETIALSTVLFLAAGLTKTSLFRTSIDWKLAAVVTLASLPTAYIGAAMVDTMPVDWLRRLLGLSIVAYLLITTVFSHVTIKLNQFGLIAGSGVYGFVSGLLGSGNVIKALLFRELAMGKESFVGIMAATSILTNVAKLNAYANDGLLHERHLVVGGALVACAVVSAYIGRNIMQKIPLNRFRHGVSLVLFCAALNLLW